MNFDKSSIVEAAVQLWNEVGYAESSMRQLARRMNASLPRLYEHFSSKEQIALHLYRRINDEAAERFAATSVGNDPGLRLQAYLQAKLAVLEPYRRPLVGIFQQALDPHSPLSPLSSDSSSTLDASLGIFQEMLEQSKVARGPEARQLARLLWVSHLAVILFWLHDRSPESAQTRRLVVRFGAIPGLLKMRSLLPGFGDLTEVIASLFAQAPARVEVAAVSQPEDRYDVVVIGAGPIGVLYACWVKLQRPETSILLLEKAGEPGHKIGESTLSGFCKACLSIGIPKEAMRRLFFLKNGLGFFHADGQNRDLASLPEYILETFDETYQVERRVLDSLLLARARQLGVQVLQGAEVHLADSTLAWDEGRISYTVAGKAFRVGTRLVVDASGPAGLLARHHGLYTRTGLPFQTGAVWGYFRNVRSLDDFPGWKRRSQFPRDQYTQHICFREGWMWRIPLVSWAAAPTNNLQAMLGSLLSGAPIPERDQLSRRFGCPQDDLVSVGLVLRSDRDQVLQDDPASAFEVYRQRYPAVARALEGAELVRGYAEAGVSYQSRLNMRGWSREVTGDGWLAIGDAAFFVDPLISPGLTGGTAGAYRAAELTLGALRAGRFGPETFADYEVRAHELHDALERDNQMVYMSFNHPEAMALVQRFQEIDARLHFHQHEAEQYGIGDTNVWGILAPDYQALQRPLCNLMREEEERVLQQVAVEEQSPPDYEPMVARMQALLKDRLEAYPSLNPYVTQNLPEVVH